ncbi:HAD-IIA family hydrolase [Bacillus atrophaeus]|uniref:HAD-IIA family hydrolase n=1 Tax=Bacillus atrophaeus TaxID=1452 RepID=UPI002DBFCB48|nr:HAD-IIA family hydrolase [Bacillus atrophaeus]MEC0766166.1 HAD-IIA family hydrolase [Bacillus atrophaeus]MEC0778501.1 HAD-IIA family hydrolase [Bacillus atrophaeus]MEC0808537.1 HAD-IIA family hydrolase [Bacillus atrophaeus]
MRIMASHEAFVSPSGFLIDIDGTIFRGNELIEGAKEAICMLRRMNKKLVFLSNRGNISRNMCKKKLLEAGIDAVEREIVLSSSVTAAFLKKHYSDSAVWVLGEEGLIDELNAAGIQMANEPKAADWLIISLHESLTYQDLNQAFQAAASGARIIATNKDRYFPRENGNAIDVAGMIGAIEASAQAKTELVVGKPSWLMAEAACDAMQLTAGECMIIGDSIESDIAMGKLYGMKSALVLTGSSKPGEARVYEPDFVLESIKDLNKLAEEGILL